MRGGLSIVIPTHGRHDLVAALLVSISEDARNVEFAVEIIIVDDSTPEEATKIRRVAIEHNAKILYGIIQVGEKRNYGVKESAHEIVLFLDSDVKIRQGTLKAHYNRLSHAPKDVAGCLGKIEFVGQETYAWKVIEVMQLTLPFSYPDIAEQVPWGPTANLSIRRSLFLKVGGFDTSLPKYGGEDVDIGLRLNDQGFRIITAKDAIAEHAIETWSTWRQNIPRLWSFGLADYHLLVRHPNRVFLDFPTGPMLWIAQFLILTVLVVANYITLLKALCAFGASITAYPFVYALLKQKGGSGSRIQVHLLGPLIFWTMDLAKAVEAVRRRRPDLIFKRVKFLDDLIAQDWNEIAASAWGLTGSAIIFLAVIVML